MLLLKNLWVIQVSGVIYGWTIICDGTNGAISCNRSCFPNGQGSALVQKPVLVAETAVMKCLALLISSLIGRDFRELV